MIGVWNLNMSIESEYNKLLQRVATNVRRLRKECGLTQEEMSRKGGFNYRFYQKLESGKYSPNLYTLFRIAKTQGVKISDLLDRSPK
ncbi:XRE family transcriptional regulator [bacterium]|nr:XRE family transcriptional regulator [bacterium]